jgi:ribonuclease P/MRP protein subunit RPP40
LTTLETRRLHGDLVEMFKIFEGFDDLEARKYFEFSSTAPTRGHGLKLVKHGCHLDSRNFFHLDN